MRKAARIAYAALIAVLAFTLAASSYAAFSRTVSVTGTMTLRASGSSGTAATAAPAGFMMMEQTGVEVGVSETKGTQTTPTPGETGQMTAETTPGPTPDLAQESPAPEATDECAEAGAEGAN